MEDNGRKVWKWKNEIRDLEESPSKLKSMEAEMKKSKEGYSLPWTFCYIFSSFFISSNSKPIMAFPSMTTVGVE